jgi:hypothetical protein
VADDDRPRVRTSATHLDPAFDRRPSRTAVILGIWMDAAALGLAIF